jgi:hypothetical protein
MFEHEVDGVSSVIRIQPDSTLIKGRYLVQLEEQFPSKYYHDRI